MFRIRRIFDDVLPVNRQAIREVKKIFMEHFAAAAHDIADLEERLRNPFKKRFRTILYVAEKIPAGVLGFAIVLHEPELQFCFLDYIATRAKVIGRGVGAALYEYVRDEALAFGAKGLFFECPPDERDQCETESQWRQNVARLRFYERYGARPILGTRYQTPVPGGSDKCLPYLVYDDLDQGRPLDGRFAQQVVRAILERKYDFCPPDYVQMVVESFAHPILREFRYHKPGVERKMAKASPPELIAMTVNDKHDIHHIRERGYVEAPIRVRAILDALMASGLVERIEAPEYPMAHITAVHDPEFVEYLEKACAAVGTGASVYPYVFPIRNATRPPKELTVRAGYYCIDTFTPINGNAFPAARRAVDCALAAADQLLSGRRVAYALVRPPGHHAERRAFGGFCYFNNAAVAAHYLSAHGKVAILDIDYHHGNGQQEIFYERADVLTVSIHGDPDFAYPYFTGFADERGAGPGEGFNVNIPLPENIDGPAYRSALQQALHAIRDFAPAFLVVALGLDTAKGDPTGTWQLNAKDFYENGRMIGGLHLPLLVVQEGGYRTRTLGVNARNFFAGITATASRR
ncbi:MAG: hypothetical protein KatS3mg110_4340 [Pirellulaceae bacterium]|nr:MAG: hypothetical protein KatS3mg110_4340 [Pirellulaceae bacterium]